MSSDHTVVDCSLSLSLSYPYENAQDEHPTFNDVYDRDMSQLLSSFGRISEQMLANKFSTSFMRLHQIEMVLRICTDCLQAQDFTTLVSFGTQTRTTTSILVGPGRKPRLLPNVGKQKSLKQIILVNHTPPNSWQVFRIPLTLSKSENEVRFVDIFFVGSNTSQTNEIGPFLDTLSDNLSHDFPKLSFQYRRRLQVPTGFTADPIWIAFATARSLHYQGTYLDINQDVILRYKHFILRNFKLEHDKWMGHFLLERAIDAQYPFLCAEHAEEDNLTELRTMGWSVIDVEGDGNCGYYALLLCLENIGIDVYTPKLPERTTTIQRQKAWQAKVLKLRQDLYKHSKKLIQTKFLGLPPENFPLWWPFAVTTEKENPDDIEEELDIFHPEVIEKLSDEFIIPKGKISNYFNGNLPRNKQMSFNWAPIVIASLFECRVVIKARQTMKDNSFKWLTITVSFQNPMNKDEPHITHSADESNSCTCMTLAEFKQQPTIEILYHFGFFGSMFHYQTLRRVLYDNIGNQDYVPLNPETLGAVLQRQSPLNNEPNETVVTNDFLNQMPLDEATNPTITGVSEQEHIEPNETVVTNDFLNQMPLDEATNPTITGVSEQHTAAASKKRGKKQGNGPTNTRTSTGISEEQDNTEPVSKRGKGLVVPRKRRNTNIEKVPTMQQRPDARVSKASVSAKRARSATISIKQRVKELDAIFDRDFDSLTHKTVTRMKYDPSTNTFRTKDYSYALKRFKNPVLRDDVSMYDPRLRYHAIECAGHYVGNTPGDPGTRDAPPELTTKVRTLHQQLDDYYCFSYSLASALYYCDFKDASFDVVANASGYCSMHYDQAVTELRSLMCNACPLIARPTIFGKRTARGKLRRLTWDDLFTELTPYPTLVIPVLSDGTIYHAFCVVDDLIFDSITPFALKLKKESLDWIFHDKEVHIFQAYRFDTKYSPKGVEVEGTYDRAIKLHP
jgi:hypothetical protein